MSVDALGPTGIADWTPVPLKNIGISFVGRRAELDLVRRTWRRSTEGTPRIVVVAGESGMGKTRFCYQIQRSVAVAGGQVMTGFCSASGDRTPYSLWQSILNCADARGGLKEESASFSDGPDQELLLFRKLEIRCRKPSLLLVEDIQWIDELSGRLLERILRQADDWPILLLVSLNTDDPSEREVLLRRLTSAGSVATWLEMKRLSQFEMTELAEKTQRELEIELSHAVVDQVLRTSDGSPLFLIELIREAALQSLDGRTPVTDAPPNVNAVLRRRLRTLDKDARQVLTAIAICGASTDANRTAAIAGCAVSEVVIAVARLVEMGLLSRTPVGLQLRHELFREAAENMMDPVARAALHERAAYVLELDGASDAIVAQHYHAAGHLEKAYLCALSAADQSEKEGALHSAERHLKLAEMACPIEAERIQLAVRRSRILCLLGANKEALNGLIAHEGGLVATDNEIGICLTNLIAAIDLHEGGQASAEWLAERLRNLLWKVRNDDLLLTHTARYLLTCAHDSGNHRLVEWLVNEIADDRISGNGKSTAEMLVLAANAVCIYGEPKDAHGLLDRAESLGGPAVPGLNVFRHLVRGITAFVEGSLEEAKAHLDAGLLQSDRDGGQRYRGRLLTNLAVVHLEAGEYDNAFATLRMARCDSSKHQRAVSLANEGVWCIQTGRYDGLVELIADLDRFNARTRSQWVEVVSLTFRGFWHLHHGYVERAYGIADALAQRLTPERRDVSDRSYTEILIARTCTSMGQRSRAVERMRAILQSYPGAQWAGRLRIETELAGMIAKEDPAEAIRLVKGVRAVAKRNGAYAHVIATQLLRARWRDAT